MFLSASIADVTIAFVALIGLRLCRVPTNKKEYLQNAKQQIRDKIEGRIASGPSGLRRAFQFFDRDGGGTIDLDEFKNGLEKYCGLKFTDSFVEELMNEFDDGSGSITYHSFCELVMGSKSTDATGFVAPTPKAPPSPSTRQSLFTLEPPEVAAPPVTEATEQNEFAGRVGIGKNSVSDIKKYIIERVEAKSANVRVVFRNFDADKSGSLDYSEFRRGLERLGVALNDKEFGILMQELDNDGGGTIDYNEFVEDMKENDASNMAESFSDERNRSSQPAATVMDATGIGRTDIAGIKNFIIERVEAKNANLSAVFRKFDEDKSGNLSYPEFRKGLLALGSKYNAQIVSQVCQVCSLNCVDVGLSPAQSRGVRHFD
eukprot:COSAG01_NODE_15854_length_1292_cov_0.897737_1_plen_374_part_00